MKNNMALMLLISLLFISCDADEQMQYAKIYFPLATWAEKSDFFVADFNYEKDNTYIIGAYCGGSIPVPQEVKVSIGLATDSLVKLQAKDPSLANYEILPESSYEITPSDMVAVIKKNTSRGDLQVVFHTADLDPAKQYVLPLYIKSTSHYELASQHSYLFFGIRKQ